MSNQESSLFKDALIRLTTNKLSLFSLIYIAICLEESLLILLVICLVLGWALLINYDRYNIYEHGPIYNIN